MKNLFKFAPIALAAIALASCSNDNDFFGSENIDGLPTLTINSEAIEDDATRSSFFINAQGKNENYWQSGDKFRVYDANLQKYDDFTFNTEARKFTGPATLAAASQNYVMYPADKISYAGFKNGTGLVALMKLDKNLSYTDALTATDGATAYLSFIPQIGEVTDVDADKNLEAKTTYLTGWLKIELGNGAKEVGEIRVTAQKWNASTTSYDNGSPLSGVFEATMDTENSFNVDVNTSKLQAVAEAANDPFYEVVSGSYDNVISVGGAGKAFNMSKYTSLVYIPIIAGTYDRLVVDVYNNALSPSKIRSYALGKKADGTGTAKEVKAGHSYANADWYDATASGTYVATTAATKKMGYTADAEETLTDGYTTEITALLKKYGTLGGSAVEVEVDLSTQALTTLDISVPEYYTITIPSNQSNDVIITFTGADVTSVAGHPLTIAGGNANYKTTFNFPSGTNKLNGNLILNTTGKVAITGAIDGNITGTTADGAETGGLSLGTAGDAITFTTSKTATIKSGAVTIDNNSTDIKTLINNGTGKVTVEDGAIGDLQGKAGAVDVNDGTITTLSTTSGVITMTDGTISTSITTTAASISAGGTIAAINVGAATTDIKLTSGVIDALAVSADPTANTNFTVTSSGDAALKAFTGQTHAITTFVSIWDENSVASDIFDGTNKYIYTAAQLASAGVNTATKNFLTKVTFAEDAADWASPALTAAFDGAQAAGTGTAAITAIEFDGINKPLFATITGTSTVQNVKLSNIAIADAAEVGALTSEVVSGTVGITNVVVNGGTIGAANGLADLDSKAVGGLVGKLTAGTTTFTNCGVTATVQGYAALGGLVGEMAGDKVVFVKGNNKSNVTFNRTVTITTNKVMEYAMVGNLIGTVSDADADITIGDTDQTFSDFYTNNINATTLEFAKNKNASNKTFKGMTNMEIGYSTGEVTDGKLSLYGATNDGADTPKNYAIKDANKSVQVNIYNK